MNKSTEGRLNSKIAEYLIEQLTIENAVVDRLVTRIHEVPIVDLKHRLEQYLRETMGRQEGLHQLIIDLGGKPTDSKADLPILKLSNKDTMTKALQDKIKSLTILDDYIQDAVLLLEIARLSNCSFSW